MASTTTVPPTSTSPTTAPSSFSYQTFDYLVIGGGTAGLVVASRLSENPNIRVGVLEAGPSALDEPLINIPGRFGESLGTNYDWKFETVPQDGIMGRQLAWPRGKVLGGTSALNFMTWNRGCREDYDAWEALGNEGWGWDGLLCVRFPVHLSLANLGVQAILQEERAYMCTNRTTAGGAFFVPKSGRSRHQWANPFRSLRRVCFLSPTLALHLELTWCGNQQESLRRFQRRMLDLTHLCRPENENKMLFRQSLLSAGAIKAQFNRSHRGNCRGIDH